VVREIFDESIARVFGSTRALGPGHPDLPGCFREAGQPVLVGGTRGSAIVQFRLPWGGAQSEP